MKEIKENENVLRKQKKNKEKQLFIPKT